jgi:hypothetical protein
MRIIRLADARVVVHIRRRNEVLVAVPARLTESDILAMASLVLTGEEFAELAGSFARARGDQRAPSRGKHVQRRMDVGATPVAALTDRRKSRTSGVCPHWNAALSA